MSQIGNVGVKKNAGAIVGIQPSIDFTEGANVTLTIANDPANHEIDITIAVTYYQRYGLNLLSSFGVKGPGTLNANRAYILPIQLEAAMTIDRVIWVNDTISVGNFRVGIYADNGDTPVGGALLAESGAIATAGVSQKQEGAIAPGSLAAGLYWLVWNHDDGADRFERTNTTSVIGGTLGGHYYALAFGAFTDPCPATTIGGTRFPVLGYRVASVP